MNKQMNIHTMGLSDGEEREKGAEKLFEELIFEIFPNLVRVMDNQVQDMIKPKITPKYTIIRMLKSRTRREF